MDFYPFIDNTNSSIQSLEGDGLNSLIDIKNIYKKYCIGTNEVFALKNVSLKINQGEFVTIIGKSGSGKSTLMNILGCLDAPSSGEYHLLGEPVFKTGENKLAEIRNKTIGFIFQSFNLIPNLTALENVELPLIYRGMPKNERLAFAKEALFKVGLETRLHHKPNQMSGGQQQRVAIARAIAGKPSIILADEPTGNLDSSAGAEVLSILKALNAEKKTIVLITHDDNIAKSASRVVKIIDGKITD